MPSSDPVVPCASSRGTRRPGPNRWTGMLSAIVALVLGSVACSSGSQSSVEHRQEAGREAARMFESRLDGRTNEAWDQLVTQQQELMSVDVFAACSEPEPVDEPMVEVLDTFFESIRIPGTMQSLQTVAVDLRLTGRQDGKPVDRVRRMTVAEVDDVWRWALDPDEIVECLGPDHRPAGSDEADEPEDLEEPQDAPGPEG